MRDDCFPRDDNPGHAAFRLHMAFHMSADAKMKPLGVSHREAFTLLFLTAHGPDSLVEMANRFGLSHPSLLRHVDMLEQQGLIERAPHPKDRRKKMIQLTKKGCELAPHVKQRMQELQQQAVEGIPPEKLREAIAVLRRMEANLSIKRES